jgi:peptidoglycan/xylan/chitin deacetylase (PgdA/CDA1 family)
MAVPVLVLEGQREEAQKMKCVSLLYHDVVAGNDWESSGFSGPGTARYKLNRAEFDQHLSAIASARPTAPKLATEIYHEPGTAFPFLLTFDDGGESAYTCIADVLGRHGWKAHFFITASYIGTKGFVNAEQIRGLRKSGHLIGSHSFSHPKRMANCSTEKLNEEWIRSVEILSAILGEPVNAASVPGGYFSKRVAETAAAAGIRTLFNSEPTTSIHVVNGCNVIGRFNILRGMPPAVSADLVSTRSSFRSRQWAYWNLKKMMKLLGGRHWIAAREHLLRTG